MPKNKGFTLIEIILAVSILMIMAGVVIILINPVQLQQRSRDARRKADLEAIRQALELYRADNASKRYPVNGWYGSTSGASWIPGLVPDYISELPVDPINNSVWPWQAGHYSYAYYSGTWCGAIAGTEYILTAQLESGTGNYVRFKGCSWGGGTRYVVEEP